MRHLKFFWTSISPWCIDIRDSSEWNRDSRTDAQSLSLSRFPFIFALVVTKEVLANTKGLSVNFQGRYVDVVKAHKRDRICQVNSTECKR
jgi:hypothetical protein